MTTANADISYCFKAKNTDHEVFTTYSYPTKICITKISTTTQTYANNENTDTIATIQTDKGTFESRVTFRNNTGVVEVKESFTSGGYCGPLTEISMIFKFNKNGNVMTDFSLVQSETSDYCHIYPYQQTIEFTSEFDFH